MSDLRLAFLLILIAIPSLIGAAFFSGPVMQDPEYHLFADSRTLLGVPNFWNVATNLALLIAGLAGLHAALLRRTDPLFILWIVFFLGMVLTAIGSASYHLDPSNESLFWDRLAMSVGFAGLFAIVIGEYVSAKSAKWLLLPLLLTAAASVVFWISTERLGAGDLRPYLLVQFLPLLLIPIIVYAGRGHLGIWIAFAVAFYFVAKLAEYYDAEIYSAGGLLSGHSLKHLFAALAPAAMLVGLKRRQQEPRVRDFPK